LEQQVVDFDKAEQRYLEEISLLAEKDVEDYILLNLRKISAYRRQFDIPVVGIAGLEGKTTTMRMLSAILTPGRKVLETPLNCSSTFGITSTLLKLEESHQIALFELGIVDPIQFERAVKVTAPTIGAITNIGESHLASLGDKYLIADAKVELVRSLPNNGYAVLNIDDDLVSAMAKFALTPNVIKFGLNKNAQFFANKIEYLGPNGIEFFVNGYYPFYLPIYSSTSIYNALTAISIARILGIEYPEIKEGLESRFSLLAGTGNLITRKDAYILDYTYDATVNAVPKACESLVQFKPYSKKLILVIGDVRDPGPRVRDAHLKIGYYIAALPINLVLTIGPNAKYIAEGIKRLNHSRKGVEVCKDEEELLRMLEKHFESQSTLLFTGSKDLNLALPLREVLGVIE